MHNFKYCTAYIVDDDKTANLVHHHVMKRISVAGEIRTFTNPLKALEELQKELLEEDKRILVLLDLHMPEMNGFEFLEASALFSLRDANLDIIMVTSSIDARELQLGTENPLVRKVITKPLKGNQVLDFVMQRAPISA